MFLSKKSIFGIRAVAVLLKENRPMRIAEIARRSEIPKPFLAIIINELIRAGILYGKRGPGGGVEVKLENVRLKDIINVFGDKLDSCILGQPVCSSKKKCLLHNMWSETRKQIERLTCIKIKDII